MILQVRVFPDMLLQHSHTRVMHRRVSCRATEAHDHIVVQTPCCVWRETTSRVNPLPGKQKIFDDGRVLFVERPRRFVGKYDFRRIHQCTGDGDSLPFAPESASFRCSALSPSPTLAKALRPLFRILHSPPANNPGIMTFSNAVKSPRSKLLWNTNPIFLQRISLSRSSSNEPRSSSSNKISPLSGRSKDAHTSRSVDLPHPLFPTTATLSPHAKKIDGVQHHKLSSITLGKKICIRCEPAIWHQNRSSESISITGRERIRRVPKNENSMAPMITIAETTQRGPTGNDSVMPESNR